MVKIKCDKCGQSIPMEDSRFFMYDIFNQASNSKPKSEIESLSISTFNGGALRQVDLCNDCKAEIYRLIFYSGRKENENK